jgi:hypothetical protein
MDSSAWNVNVLKVSVYSIALKDLQFTRFFITIWQERERGEEVVTSVNDICYDQKGTHLEIINKCILWPLLRVSTLSATFRKKYLPGHSKGHYENPKQKS